MTALLLVIASMAGCPSKVPPADPVPVVYPIRFARCDPARLGWAADGSFWFSVQQSLNVAPLLRATP
jgi:hypothetical protein